MLNARQCFFLSSTIGDMTTFHSIYLYAGTAAFIPESLELIQPSHSLLPPERQYVLIELRWRDSYLERVPIAYREFFISALPHLRVRTTDVHTATSVSFLPELLAGWGRPVHEAVVYAALILHDSGWSRVDEVGIADSLDGRGLRHGGGPGDREPHDVFGAEIAAELLRTSSMANRLGAAGQREVIELVGNHTWGEHYRRNGQAVPEMLLLCDADRLWSYTFENYWQDTVRKRVEPHHYLDEIEASIESYMLTPTGIAMAHRMVAERRSELGDFDRSVRAGGEPGHDSSTSTRVTRNTR